MAKKAKPRRELYDPIKPADIPRGTPPEEAARLIGSEDPAKRLPMLAPEFPDDYFRKSANVSLPAAPLPKSTEKANVVAPERLEKVGRHHTLALASPEKPTRPTASLPSPLSQRETKSYVTSPMEGPKLTHRTPLMNLPSPMPHKDTQWDRPERPRAQDSSFKNPLESPTTRVRNSALGVAMEHARPELRKPARQFALPSPEWPMMLDTEKSLQDQTLMGQGEMGLVGMSTYNPFGG